MNDNDKSAAAKSRTKDRPNVIAPPPLIVLYHLLVGIGIEWFVPTGVLSLIFARSFGWLLIFLAAVIIVLCWRQFVTHQTHIHTARPATALIQTGLYRFSRNPIYAAFVLSLIGLGIAFNSLWIALTSIPFIFIVNWGVISREEAYLTEKFGEEYTLYKSQVRRWI